MDYENRIESLKKVKPEKWDTFLDEVKSLLEAIDSSRIMRIAQAAIIVEDHLLQIRRLK